MPEAGADLVPLKSLRKDPSGRDLERVRDHYRIERELSDRLRNATREERNTLYGEVYDELFRRVPDHPQHVAVEDPSARQHDVSKHVAAIRRILPEGATFLEIGAGDCALSVRVAQHVRQAIAVDVSADIAVPKGSPPNLEVRITDGRTFPVPDGSIDVAYSNQLLEHLHPDDAEEQVQNVLKALKPGGAYICLTPHRVSGPHDISAYFDEEPRGFHLREYGTQDMVRLFRDAGFGRVKVLARLGLRSAVLPSAPFVLLERLVALLPRRLRQTPVAAKIVSPGGGVVAYRR